MTREPAGGARRARPSRPRRRRATAAFGFLALIPFVAAVVLGGRAPVAPVGSVPTVETTVPAAGAIALCPGPPRSTRDIGASVTYDPKLAGVSTDLRRATRVAALGADSPLLDGSTRLSRTDVNGDGDLATITAPELSAMGLVRRGVLRLGPRTSPLGATIGDAPAASNRAVDPVLTRVAPTTAGTAVTATLQATIATSGDLRAATLFQCAAPSSTATIVGGSSRPGDGARLTLANPTDRPSLVSLEVFDERGRVDLRGADEIVVGPHSSSSVLLAALSPGSAALAVRAVASGAPVAAAVQVDRLDGLVPRGTSLVPPSASARRGLVLPGIEIAAGGKAPPPRLVMLNRSGSAGSATVRLVGRDGPVARPGGSGVRLRAESVTAIGLGRLPAGRYTAFVDANVPITGTVEFSSGSNRPSGPTDLATIVSGGTIDAPVIVPVPRPEKTANRAAASLTLAAPRGTAARVTIIPLSATAAAGRATVREVGAGSSISVALGRGAKLPAAIAIVPDIPGSLSAGLTLRFGDGSGELLASATIRSPPDDGPSPRVRVE